MYRLHLRTGEIQIGLICYEIWKGIEWEKTVIYTKRDQLTIVELENLGESVPIKKLKAILEKYPSNILYCETDRKLVGIISTGDISRACEKKQNVVLVNKQFISLSYGKYIEAKKIFAEKSNIHAIPVVTKDRTLLGDYTRWDDLSILEYAIGTAEIEEDWKQEYSIALVKPNPTFRDRESGFKKVKAYLESQRVNVKCITYMEIADYLKIADVVLAVDENEIRAYRTALRIIFGDNYEGKDKLKTYKTFFSKEINFSDNQCALYLRKLQKKGIKIIGLTFKDSAFYRQLIRKIENRFVTAGKNFCNRLPESMYQEFFGELYSEEYADGIMNMPIECENSDGVLYLRECKSRYYNVVNGERCTLNQLDSDTGSIYFFGPCYIYGHYVEDKYTIESLLSKRISQEGGRKRIVNCGNLGADSKNRYLFRIMTTQFNRGDILVIDRPPENISGVYYLDLNRVLEEKNPASGWFVDAVWHCNHKVNQLYADAIYDVLFPELCKDESGWKEPLDKDDSFIEQLYLSRYFNDFDTSEYEQIGAIVMNCNPFTYGHRYLIEQALKMVDFLIIFVVEEDRSTFSFAERFAMVKMGVTDLTNVLIVPSGPFILSQMSFPEYFIKETSENIREHMEQDIKTFAEKIAPYLGIKYRLAGEEPEDEVTNQYNMTMKEILPEYGIKFVEVPRKTIGEEYISASFARRYIEKEDMDKLAGFLPVTTREVLGL